MTETDTIFAPATPPGPCAAALVRVSGPACARLWRDLAGQPWARATARARLPLAAGSLPCVLLASPAPRSYTAQDTLEIVLPGNPVLVGQTEQWLVAAGCRRAEAGEFTRRALDHGRITPSQASATLALVNAQTAAAQRRALAELRGDLARHADGLAERLRHAAARHEMLFDFAEEEHAEAAEASLSADLHALAAELSAMAGAPPRAPRTEPLIALFGPPNAGKSALFNALLGATRALVSPLPGTTRDAVSAPLVLQGRTAMLVDLSGVGGRDTDAGRFAAQARQRALQADVLLLLAAPGQHDEAMAEFRNLLAVDADLPGRSLLLDTMCDLPSAPGPAAPMARMAVSAATGAGLQALRLELHRRLVQASVGEGYSLLRERAAQAAAILLAALADPDIPPEARAREVRHALTLLDEGLLASAPGDVLDFIFGQFCIGK